jgi:uncharacterized membrane protein
MEISSGFLLVGLVMTLAGTILIYLSLRADLQELHGDSDGVWYIGFIPIVVNGGRKWILTALLITAVIFSYLVVKTTYPSIFGGL